MSYLITKEKVQPLYLWPLCILFCLFLSTPSIMAQAATFPVLPQDPSTYTKKTANYNPEYEYCLYKVYSYLPALGHETTTITVPGFAGNEDEARAFGQYIYQYYDYTGRLNISCTAVTDRDQLYNLHISFDDPQQIYTMQVEAEQKLLNFSKTLIGLSDRDKIVKANDWIASNAVYDESLKKNSCYSNVVEGASTCNGYTRALYAICSYSGIKCENIRGYANNMLHIWNKVYIDGKWLYVDVTWNSMAHSNSWLLISKEEMGKDHSTT